MDVAFVAYKVEAKNNYFSSVEDLLASKKGYDVVALASCGFSDVLQLRQDLRYQYCLVYTASISSDDISAISNGLLPEKEFLLEEYQAWQQRLLSFHLDVRQSAQDVYPLLKYLWLHPSTHLVPIKYLGTKYIYSYPLLRVFSWDESEEQQGLNTLLREGLLRTVSMVNKLRLCAQCNDSRLNFIETCPQCGDIDLKQEVALHCFTCGHIAEQHSFATQDGLSCPNCTTVLRHIGVDYDRPIENIRCQSCDAFFVDAEVKASCLACDSSSSPNQLSSSSIYEYSLGDKAMQLIRGEQGKTLNLELGHDMDYEPFCWAVNWCLNLGLRHSVGFAVVVLSINNTQQLIDELGEVDTSVLVFDTGKYIRSILRVSDLTCRLDSGNILLLFPNTDEAGLAVIQQKLSAVKHIADHKSKAYLDLAFHSAILPKMQQDSEDGHMLIARLLSEFESD